MSTSSSYASLSPCSSLSPRSSSLSTSYSISTVLLQSRQEHISVHLRLLVTHGQRSLQRLLHLQARSSNTLKKKYHQVMLTVRMKDIKRLQKNKSYSLVIQSYLMIINDNRKSLLRVGLIEITLKTKFFI